MSEPLFDTYGRAVTYLRLSLTDRCDFRCTYCMAEKMTFLPRADLLTFEELLRLSQLFVSRGVNRIRLTGGEPLVRRDAMKLVKSLGNMLDGGGLEELTLTTNGSQLAQHAAGLKAAGVRRINISLDTLDEARFRAITRRGDLDRVLAGLDAASAEGLAVKINVVALKDTSLGEYHRMLAYAADKGFDVTFIEVMPLGDTGIARSDQFLPLTELKSLLEDTCTFNESTMRTGGPARYHTIAETGQRVGFISPLTQNFCEGCNRVRLTCTGKLYMCLGQEGSIDFRTAMRGGASDMELNALIDKAMHAKPLGHDFALKGRDLTGGRARHMSVTGG